MAESIIGLFKTELIRRKGPWRGLDAVELATMEWVDWYNNRRLFEAIGDIPPAEPKPTTTAQPRHLKTCRWQKPASTKPGAVQTVATPWFISTTGDGLICISRHTPTRHRRLPKVGRG